MAVFDEKGHRVFTDKEREEFHKEYCESMHAIQSGIAMHMKLGDVAEPKHLRVGIDSAMVSNAAVVELLVKLGLCSWDDYFVCLLNQTKQEVKRSEAELSAKLGSKVTLR